MAEAPARREWPCYFFESDTTGEKDFEEFYTDDDQVDWDRYKDIAVIRNDRSVNVKLLDNLLSTLQEYLRTKKWTKSDLVKLFSGALEEFAHKETYKYLDDRM
jgi:FlaA1/EpsC-like NDP-sugar epimerase